MSTLEVYINGEKLELFEDETVNLNSSIQNIKDISKVFTDFTQSFTVPASKDNNKIFKHWYNASITGGFNAKIRQNAELKINTVSYKIGKIQLESVALKNNVADNYKITFYGKLINLTDLFGDDLLSELDLTAYSHAFDFANVKTGLQTGLFGGNIIYPLISSERNWDYNTPTVANEIKYNGFNGVGIYYSELKPAIKVNAIITAIENKYNVTFSNDFFNNNGNAIDELFMWLNGTESGSIGANKLTVDWNGGSSTNVNHTTDIGTFRTFNTAASNDRIYFNNVITIIPSAGYTGVNYTVRIYDGEDILTEASYGKYWQWQQSLTFLVIKTKQSGETIYNLRVEVESQEEFKFTSNWYQKKIWSSTDIVYNTTGTEQTISNELQITNNLPNLKVVDFLTGLIKMFNLVIDPITLTSFDIDTLDNWYAKGGNQDLSEYIDISEGDVKRPKLFKTISFKYEKAKAILGEAFFDINKVGYGDLESEFEVDGGNLDIKTPFENLMFERLTDTNLNTLTNIHAGLAINKELKPIVLAPVLFFNRGRVDTEQRFALLNEDGTPTAISYYLNTGQESSVIDNGSTMSLNFGSEISSWNLSTQGVSLFSVFWQDYITDLYDDRQREYKFSAYLPLKIIYNLNLNDLIIINGKRFLINNLDINLTTGLVNLNLLNYIGVSLLTKTISTLVANLQGTSTLVARLSQTATVGLSANLVGTSSMLATLTKSTLADLLNSYNVWVVAFSDEATPITTGVKKVEFQMPNYATTLVDVSVSFGMAPTTSAITIDLNEAGVSVLSTKLTVDATEKTSETAAIPRVISDTALAANAVMTIDVDSADTGGTSTGGKLMLYWKKL